MKITYTETPKLYSIRPLKWTFIPSRNTYSATAGKDIHYEVDRDGMEVCGNGMAPECCVTVKRGMRMAETHYRARIMPCLKMISGNPAK